MKVVHFVACLAIVNYEKGWVITLYDDGKQIRSQSFDDKTAAEFGYDPPDGKRLSVEHDLLHHWLAERIGGSSLNHWILAHEGDEDSSRPVREREERLIAGIMMLMRKEKVPDVNSWQAVPNNSKYYTDFAFELFGDFASEIAQQGKSYLDSLYVS